MMDSQAFCEIEAGIPSNEIGLLFNGIPLLESEMVAIVTFIFKLTLKILICNW